MPFWKRLLVLVVVLSPLSGCGRGSDPDGKVAISGTVTWNGEPLESGSLTLTGEDRSLDATKVKNGKFEIRTKPGLKHVSVTAERIIEIPEPTASDPSPVPITFQYLPASVNDLSEVNLEVKPFEPLRIELKGTKRVHPPRSGKS